MSEIAKPSGEYPEVKKITLNQAQKRFNAMLARRQELDFWLNDRMGELWQDQQRKEELKKLEAVSNRYSHDFGKSINPLWRAVSEWQLLQEQNEPSIRPALTEIPQIVADLPEMILARTEIELRGGQFKQSVIDLRTVVFDMAAFFNFAFDNNPKKRCLVYADPELIETKISGVAEKIIPALYNIINNSRRIMDQNSQGRVLIALRQERDGIVLEISDDLGGFSQDMLSGSSVVVGGKTVFKAAAFEKGRSGAGSTGIGLALVWEAFIEDGAAEISLSNQSFCYIDEETGKKIDTGKTGAFTSIKFPKKRNLI